MVWEVVFMLVVLKIPIAYLCAVVWWAVRAKPDADVPPEAVRAVPLDDTPSAPRPPTWKPRPRGRVAGPRRRPARTHGREERVRASR